MNHQIQYHTYFGASWIKLCKTVYLYEHWIKIKIFYSQKSRVKPFYMSYL